MFFFPMVSTPILVFVKFQLHHITLVKIVNEKERESEKVGAKILRLAALAQDDRGGVKPAQDDRRTKIGRQKER